MLCTPPAFILSQDQTLEIMVLKHESPRDPISLLSSLALSFFYFCLSSILICKNFRDPFQAFSLCTSLLLFNFQRSFAGAPFARRPSYYTTSTSPCQYLFQNFFRFFESFFVSARPIRFSRSPRFRGEPVYSIIFPFVCQ